MRAEISGDARTYYCQKALALSANEETVIASYVADALLSHHNGLHCVGGGSPQPERTYLPTCPQCGGPVQPGFIGASSRLVRQKALTRTQRRRLSRKTALRHKVAKNAARQGSPTLSILGKVLVSEYPHLRKEIPVQTSLKHELETSRNHVLVRCACQWKLTLPGCPRSRNSPRSQNAERAGEKERNHLTEVESQKKAKEFRQQNDFIAIARLPKRKADDKKEKNTLLAGKKKKPKKSRLMHFLSSLNDH